MEVEVELFAGLRHRAGTRSLRVEVEQGCTVAAVVAAVQRELPVLQGAMGGVARVVDDEIVDDSFEVQEGMVLALLPPVSGGMAEEVDRYLSAAALDRDRLIAETADERCGALVVFSGDIRNHNKGRRDVVAIDYEAHSSMAARVLAEIEAEVVENFEVHRCRVQHRLGRVEVGESSVLVVCRGAHRDGAFQGARYAIDELKRRVPLWKHEFYGDGTSEFLDGTPLEGRANED